MNTAKDVMIGEKELDERFTRWKGGHNRELHLMAVQMNFDTIACTRD